MKSRFIVTEMPTGYCVRWAHNNRAVGRFVLNEFSCEKLECYLDAVSFINGLDYVLDKYELGKVQKSNNLIPVTQAPKSRFEIEHPGVVL